MVQALALDPFAEQAREIADAVAPAQRTSEAKRRGHRAGRRISYEDDEIAAPLQRDLSDVVAQPQYRRHVAVVASEDSNRRRT